MHESPRAWIFFKTKSSIGLLLLLLLSSSGCKTTSSSLSAEGNPKVSAFLKKMYAKYNPYEIQDDAGTPDDCGSFYIPSDGSIPNKGVVVLFHGYTACPQQYWEIGQTLRAKGYSTLSVLLPGQGRAPAPFGFADKVPLPGEGAIAPLKEGDVHLVKGRPYAEYYAEFIPKVQNGQWKTYLEFVEDVNAFVRTLPGEKLLGGLSVGSELATYAYIQSPGLYKRALLTSPYYGMPGPDLYEKFTGADINSAELYKMQKKIVLLGSRDFAAVAQIPVSWGLDCYRQTYNGGKPGRAGICDFRFENLAAINSLGDYLLTLLKSRKELTEIPQIQYVGIELDIGADSNVVRKAIAYQTERFGKEKVSACFYPHSVPHSFFSRKDLVLLKETPWLDSFYDQAVGFLLEDKKFKLDGQPSVEFVYDGEKEANRVEKQARCAF